MDGSTTTISDMLDLPVGTVRSGCCQARMQMKDLLQEGKKIYDEPHRRQRTAERYLDGEVTAVKRKSRSGSWPRMPAIASCTTNCALRQHLESLPMARLPADFSQSVLDAGDRWVARGTLNQSDSAVEAHDSSGGRR
jgi:hypothetical protein